MAVIENRVTEDGDVLIIKPEAPIVGLISLYQFVDTTEGEVLTDYFRKEYRYSADGGLTFSSWLELTLINIQGVTISQYSQFVIEYRYTRVGNTPNVTLSFDDILVSGEITQLPYPVYNETPFKKFFEVNDINVFGWALNVLEKLYRKGLILPDYIQRADNNDNLEDEDFIVFWNSVTHLFAILVYFARQFENFSTHPLLLQEFLKNKDLAFSQNNTLEDLVFLYSNYIEEYKNRGTLKVVQTGTLDGELLRLIDHKAADEFIFALLQNFESGWCLGKSSPTWRNTENIINIIKGYEFTKDVIDITKYPLLNDSYITLTGGNMVISDVPAATDCGIDYDNNTAHRILISPLEDYEISFRFSNLDENALLTFGLKAYTIDGIPVTLANVNSGANSNLFFSSWTTEHLGTEYLIRGILWNSNKVISGGISAPNIGVGENLKNRTNVSYIVPRIIVNSVSGIISDVTIRDIKIKPLTLNFSRGQLGIHKIIYILLKRNNGEFSEDQIREFIATKLVPYNCFVKLKSL